MYFILYVWKYAGWAYEECWLQLDKAFINFIKNILIVTVSLLPSLQGIGKTIARAFIKLDSGLRDCPWRKSSNFREDPKKYYIVRYAIWLITWLKGIVWGMRFTECLQRLQLYMWGFLSFPLLALQEEILETETEINKGLLQIPLMLALLHIPPTGIKFHTRN